MAKTPHEALHRVFQKEPALFARALEQALGISLPPVRTVSVINSDVTEVLPVARWVDTPLLVEADNGERYVIIIESQSRPERSRHLSWPYYVAYLTSKFEAPAILVVVTADASTAAWARAPIRTGYADWASQITYPLVLAPDNIPVIHDREVVEEDVMMAVLSALTHRQEPQVGETLEALASALDQVEVDTAMFLAGFTEVGLGESRAGQIWRTLMATMAYPYQSRLRQQWREEDLQKGRVEEAAVAVLRVLSARRVPVPDAVAQRIQAQTDLAELEAMLTRAVTVASAEDLFAD